MLKRFRLIIPVFVIIQSLGCMTLPPREDKGRIVLPPPENLASYTGDIKRTEEIEQELEVAAFFYEDAGRIEISVRNLSPGPVFLEYAELYCTGKLIGIYSFVRDYGRLLKLAPGEEKKDIAGEFESPYSRTDFVSFLCSGTSTVRIKTSYGTIAEAPLRVQGQPQD
jgi:hypothetical protein